jgi:hypothetical protein
MADFDRPAPAQPTVRELALRPWEGVELIGEKPPEDWPWREIIELEAQALKRARKAPKCRVCRGPMLCGQDGWHIACQKSLDGSQVS